MRLPKHLMPTDYFSVIPKTDVQITALPFYIKEVGYCNDRKFIRGACNNYSDYLFVYSLCTMKFKKNDEKHPVHSHDIIVSACNTPLTFSLPISYGKTQREYLYFIIVDHTHSSFTIISDGMTVRFILTNFITCWISFLRFLILTINQTLCRHRCMPVL